MASKIERKIVLQKQAPKRRMVEIEADLHEKILVLSKTTNIKKREIINILLDDALKYVEVEEIKNEGKKRKSAKRDIVVKNKKEYQHHYYLTVTKPKRAAKRKENNYDNDRNNS